MSSCERLGTAILLVLSSSFVVNPANDHARVDSFLLFSFLLASFCGRASCDKGKVGKKCGSEFNSNIMHKPSVLTRVVD